MTNYLITFTLGVGMKNISTKQKKLIALKKAISLLEKVKSMVDQDQYCIDIMQQNLAVIGLLKSFHQTMMAGHLSSCFQTAVKTGNKSKQNTMIDEIVKVTSLYQR